MLLPFISSKGKGRGKGGRKKGAFPLFVLCWAERKGEVWMREGGKKKKKEGCSLVLRTRERKGKKRKGTGKGKRDEAIQPANPRALVEGEIGKGKQREKKKKGKTGGAGLAFNSRSGKEQKKKGGGKKENY